MFFRELILAFRRLKSKTLFTIYKVINLVAGLATFIVIMYWASSELSFDKMVPGYQNIYLVNNIFDLSSGSEFSKSEFTSYPLSVKIRETLPDIEVVSCLAPIKFDIPVFNIGGNLFKEKNCVYADSYWFQIIKYEFVEGNSNNFNNNPTEIVISESTAKRFFGNNSAIGKILLLDSTQYSVVGVTKINKSNFSFNFDIYIPLKSKMADAKTFDRQNHWGVFSYLTFIKTHKKNSKDLENKIIASYPDRIRKGKRVELLNLGQLHLAQGYKNYFFKHGNVKLVYLLIFAAFFTLIISCINYINISTTQIAYRIKDFTIMKVLGAEKKHLMYSFFLETVLIATISILLSIGLAYYFFRMGILFNNEPLSFGFYLSQIIYTAVAALGISIVLSVVYPSIILARFGVINKLRGKATGSSYFRKAFVSLQMIIALIVLFSTVILVAQLKFIDSQYLNYEKDFVLSIATPIKWLRNNNDSVKYSTIHSLKNDLLNNSAIENISYSDQIITNIQSTSTESFFYEGMEIEKNTIFSQISVDENFKDVFNIKLLQGRWFNDSNINDDSNVVINNSAISILKIPMPIIGKKINFMGHTGTIIGITDDFHFKNLREKDGPLIFYKNNSFPYMFVKVYKGRIDDALNSLETIWKKYFPEDKVDFVFLSETIKSMYSQDILASKLMIYFSIISLCISFLGLISLISFQIQKRLKEFAIRIVLGSSFESIFKLVLKEYLILIFLSSIIALPIAFWYGNNWLEDFQTRVNFVWYNFFSVFIFCLILTLIIILIKLLYISKSKIINNLKTENS